VRSSLESALVRFVLVSVFVPVVIAGIRVSPLQQRPDPTEVLAAASEGGKRLTAALREYSYYAELTIETVSSADTITGKYYRFSQISFGADGTRQEKVFEDKSTLPKEVYIGTNAANNLTRVYQFMITPDTLTQYDFNYVGRERIDELNTLVFDVKPKIKMPDPAKSRERYLRGRVWIDDRDLMVVKVAGEALPEQSEHRTPKFETFFRTMATTGFQHTLRPMTESG
jgi:hypothetical protein